MSEINKAMVASASETASNSSRSRLKNSLENNRESKGGIERKGEDLPLVEISVEEVDSAFHKLLERIKISQKLTEDYISEKKLTEERAPKTRDSIPIEKGILEKRN